MLFVRPTRGHGGRLESMMLFVRPTRGDGGPLRVNQILARRLTIGCLIWASVLKRRAAPPGCRCNRHAAAVCDRHEQGELG